MTKVPRYLQISLAVVLVFAIAWFLVLRPKTADVAAAPTAPVETAATTTPKADAGGASAETAVGKTIENARNAADSDSAKITQSANSQQTGEENPTASTPAASTPPASKSTAPATTTPAATTPAGTTPAAGTKPKTLKVSASQAHANKIITKIQSDLKAGRVPVVLVYTPTKKVHKTGVHAEDWLMRLIVKKKINRRHGKVHAYFINVDQVGRYDGLLAGLNLAQTPSTIVIAPNDQAKVLGGFASVERINRLTSAALLSKPAKTTK
jgi:hypothetical protein